MQRKTFLILALPTVLVVASASSCNSKIKPQVDVRVPADLLDRPDYPAMTAAALESEAEGERVQDARNAWGKSIARQMDAACRLLSASGVKGLDACRPETAEWE